MWSAEERRAYLELALVSGIGPVRLAQLRQALGSYRGVLSAPFEFLCSVPSMSRAAATAVVSREAGLLVRVEESLRALGGRMLTPDDAEFPAALGTIADPPTLLFVEGRVELLSWPTVAIVGSRRPTPYGVEVTRMIGALAADAGITVASGMARGLDAVAHWAAVGRAGGTIGVLGNGLGVIYPAANRELYRRVATDGLLVTEYPPGERPNAGSFPRRNRLISALARATIVVEGGETSGALITAGTALDQGRDVLVVPGPITSRMSHGPNDLLREGATPYLDPSDLWRVFPEAGPIEPTRERVSLVHRPRRVLESLDAVPRTVDELAEALGWAPAEIAGALTELEVVGLVARGPAGFTRAP